MTIKNYMIDIIDKLNTGQEINATKFANEYEIHRRTIVNYLNNLKKCFNINSLTNNRGNWSIKKGFLKHLGLTAEELVVTLDLYISSNNCMDNVCSAQDDIASFYRHNKQIVDQNIDQEKLTSSMEIAIQNLNEAINTRKKIIIVFKGHRRVIQPFKIFRREHYWYFAGYEEEKYELNNEENVQAVNIMKTYTINTVRSVHIQSHEHISYDFRNAEIILNNSINAYMSWENKPVDVELLIKNQLSNKIKKVALYEHWNKIGPSSTLEGYDMYKTKSVNNEFKDIMPTILKYTPDILIVNPPKLRDALYKQVQALYLSELPSQY